MNRKNTGRFRAIQLEIFVLSNCLKDL